MVFDFCNDGALLRLSQTDTFVRRLLMNSQANSRSNRKGLLVRILNHKYKVAAKRLDRIQLSLN